MTSGLEDRIIAYFDGELSDADSAELLHLTSISPEIRAVFREHEMLRELAHEATRSVTVSAEVESSLFSRIQALVEEPTLKKSVLVFSRRTAVLTALALMLISGSLGYFVPKLFSSGSSTQIASKNAPLISATLSSSVAPNLPVNNAAAFSTLHRYSAGNSELQALVSSKGEQFGAEEPNLSDADNQVVDDTRSGNILQQNIQTASVREEDIHSDIGSQRYSPFDLKELPPESHSLFEASLETSSGFTYPADATPIKPFADQRLSFAFHITENNLVGFRIGSGLYQELGPVTSQIEGGVEILQRGIQTKRSFSEELFVSHLIPVYFVAPFTFELSLGGGLIPNGYTVGAEAGIRIPLSDAFLFDAAFALSRIHSNALSTQEILNSESAGMQPVMIDGVDIHNTLNGRLHYGIIYRF